MPKIIVILPQEAATGYTDRQHQAPRKQLIGAFCIQNCKQI